MEIQKLDGPKAVEHGPWEKYQKLAKPESKPPISRSEVISLAIAAACDGRPQKGEYPFKQAKNWDLKQTGQSILMALGAVGVWYLLMLMLYKTILFIAYGHTRIGMITDP